MAFIKFKPIASHFNFYSILEKAEIPQDMMKYVLDDEKIMYAFRSKRDVGILTDKRIVLIDIKGFSGLCRTISSINFKNISSYTLNVRNFDSVIEIITDSSHCMKMKFLKPIPLSTVNNINSYISKQFINN